MLSAEKNNFWKIPSLVLVMLVLLLWLVPQMLSIKPAYQLTDYLLFLLLSGFVYLSAYIRSHEHLRRPWLDVLKSRRAMASMVILVAFIITGILDSIHFRKALPLQEKQTEQYYSAEVLSVLDELISHLRNNTEQTYSAPFATHLYTRQSIITETGQQIRDYPRLEYAGIHLQDIENDKAIDIVIKTLWGGLYGLLIWSGFVLVCILLLGFYQKSTLNEVIKNIYTGRTAVPLRVMFVTAAIVILLVTISLYLSQFYHVFGTDKVGHDVFYQAVKSIRTGLVIGTLTTLVMLPFAIILGVMAGYFHGWIDDVIQYVYTTLSSIPSVLLIAASVLSIQVYIANHPELFETTADRADLRLLALCIILGITSWTGLCRLLRGEALKLREMDYIQAANAFGVGQFTILGRHVLPNVLHIVLIVVVLDFSGLVLAEAVLSYIKVGVDPSTHSWGNMINAARLELAREPVVWWSLVAAFSLMFALVLAANLFSDAVRDAFDPRIRNQQ